MRVDESTKDVGDAVADLTRPGIQGVVYAGTAVAAAGRLLGALRARDPQLPLFATSGVARPALGENLQSGGEDVRVVTPDVDPRSAGPLGRRVAARYRATFRTAPTSAALYGFEAMRSVLAAVRAAGPNGNDRAAVAAVYLRARTRVSVLGPYAFDRDGDTTRTVVGGYRVTRSGLRLERPLDGAAH